MKKVLSICLAASACAGSPVEVSEIMNHGLCNTLTAGVARIAYADLARVRGARLLTPSQTIPDEATAEDPTLVAVFNGEQPTPGYGFELVSATAHGTELVLDYHWLSPAPGAVMAQVITSPCSVVQIARAEKVSAVTVKLDGAEFGRLRLDSAQ